MKINTKYLHYIYIYIYIYIFLVSCQKEINLATVETKNIVKAEEVVKNGRFIFSSKQSLSKTIDKFQKQKTAAIESEFEKLYHNGFRSHKPIINPKNEQLKAKFSAEYAKKTSLNKSTLSNKDMEAYDGFITDPLLAAIVNENNEIIVNDTLYKFTKDKGLYFAHVKDSTYLFDFFKNESAKTTKLSSKSITSNRIDPCAERQLYGGITQVDPIISRYVAPAPLLDGDCYSSPPPIAVIPPSYPQTTVEENLQQIINNLPQCDGNASGNWVQNIFGKSYVCRNYFDDRHRIKTEFWDEKWLIYASVGVLTKTQVQTLGIWWASSSDEIHLGINRILLKYNYPKPDISSLTSPFTPFKQPIYLYNGSLMIKPSYDNYYIETALNVTKSNLPFFDFGNEPILNIYIPNLPILGDINFNYTTQEITSQANITALYKMGIDFLKDKFNSGAKKEFAVTYQKNANEIEVLYFGERYKSLDDNKIERKFYSDVNFVISAASSDPYNKWKFNIKPANDFFKNYTYYELDFYGMARNGSTWKGNRMIR